VSQLIIIIIIIIQHLYSAIVSYCHILQFVYHMFNVSTLLLDDALKSAMPLSSGMISEML